MSDLRLREGPVLKEFFIDRLAIGMELKSICLEFNELYGVTIVPETLKMDIEKWSDDIDYRSKEFIREDREAAGSLNFRLTKILKDLETASSDCLENKDYKTYAYIIGQAIRNIEVLAKLQQKIIEDGSTASEGYDHQEVMDLVDKIVSEKVIPQGIMLSKKKVVIKNGENAKVD